MHKLVISRLSPDPLMHGQKKIYHIGDVLIRVDRLQVHFRSKREMGFVDWDIWPTELEIKERKVGMMEM